MERLKNLGAEYEKVNEKNDIAQLQLESANTEIEGINAKLNLYKQFKEKLTFFASSMEKVEVLCKKRITSQAALEEKMKENLSEFKFDETTTFQVNESPKKDTYETQMSSPQGHEHKQIHSNVKAAQETEFTDNGNQAKSCQQCTIF